MDGFKNTTKTQYSMGGYATGGSAKFGKVMREFKAGTLHSGSKKGPAVTSPKQAFAIAASEARKAPMKKAEGGEVRSKLTQAERNSRDWKKDLRDSEERAVDKLGYSFNGVKIYPGNKAPSKAEREDGGRAIKRLNRLGIANRGFDAETGEGMGRPIKYDDDGRPLARADGGPVASKTGTRTDPEYGDFVAAGAAKPSAMAVKRAVPVASRTPMASAKKPLSRAMFGDEAAAAMNRAGMGAMSDAEMRRIGKVAAKERAGVGSRTAAEMARSGMGALTAAEKREGYNMGGKVMRMAEEDYGYKKGGRAKGSKGPKVMAEKMVATKRTATPTMNAQEMRTMQRYRAAMASRPRREPMIGGDMGGDQIGPAIRQLAMAPEAPPTMGMRKGGYSGMKMRKGGTPC